MGSKKFDEKNRNIWSVQSFFGWQSFSSLDEKNKLFNQSINQSVWCVGGVLVAIRPPVFVVTFGTLLEAGGVTGGTAQRDGVRRKVVHVWLARPVTGQAGYETGVTTAVAHRAQGGIAGNLSINQSISQSIDCQSIRSGAYLELGEHLNQLAGLVESLHQFGALQKEFQSVIDWLVKIGNQYSSSFTKSSQTCRNFVTVHFSDSSDSYLCWANKILRLRCHWNSMRKVCQILWNSL